MTLRMMTYIVILAHFEWKFLGTLKGFMNQIGWRMKILWSTPVDWVAFLIYLMTIPLANWMIDNVGTVQVPNGPHVISVGFGYSAPSGIFCPWIRSFRPDCIRFYWLMARPNCISIRNHSLLNCLFGIIPICYFNSHVRLDVFKFFAKTLAVKLYLA